MTIINDIGAPQALIDALMNDDYDGYKEDTISVTTLIDSPYIPHLRRLHHHEAVANASSSLS